MKVIICDDESKSCELIKQLADWQAFRMEVIGVAHSGQQALELARQNRPDLVITDVRMPGCSGPELVQRLKDGADSVDIIMISGYHASDYIKDIFDYDIVDYILKPIDRDELNAALQKAYNRYLVRTQTDHGLSPDRKELEQAAKRQRFFQDLFANALPAYSESFYRQAYDITLPEELSFVCCFKTVAFDREQLALARAVVQERLALFAGRYVEQLSISYACCMDHVTYYLINYPKTMHAQIRQNLLELNHELRCAIVVFSECRVYVAMTKARPVSDGLSAAGPELTRLMRQHLVQPNNSALKRLPSDTVPLSGMPAWNTFLQGICSAVSTEDTAAIDACFSALAGALLPNIRLLDGYDCYTTFLGMGETFCRWLFPGGGEHVETEAFQTEYGRILENIDSPSGLLAALPKLLTQVLEHGIQRRKESDTRVVAMVNAYIAAHYTEPLTAEEIKRRLDCANMETLYRQHTGIAIEDQIVKTRVLQAKALLRDESIDPRSVCARVGYPDSRSFRRDFKHETGISVRLYRNLYAKR